MTEVVLPCLSTRSSLQLLSLVGPCEEHRSVERVAWSGHSLSQLHVSLDADSSSGLVRPMLHANIEPGAGYDVGARVHAETGRTLPGFGQVLMTTWPKTVAKRFHRETRRTQKHEKSSHYFVPKFIDLSDQFSGDAGRGRGAGLINWKPLTALHADIFGLTNDIS